MKQVAHKGAQAPKIHKPVAGGTGHTKHDKEHKSVHKKHRSIHNAPYPYVDPEYVEQNFANKYGFKKSPTGRSPVSSWEHAHILKDEDIHVHPHEARMVRGTPSGFGHHEGHRGQKAIGTYRLSGHHKAHQIGKRG